MQKLVFWLLLIFLTSCNINKSYETQIIDEEIFIDVLVDIHLADGILAVKGYNINRDSTNIELVYQDVINKYNTTQKQFLETVTYYSKEPREYERIYEKVSEKLAKLESELEEESKKKREENAKKNKDKIQK